MCGIDLGSNKITGVIGRVEGKTLSLFGAASVESAGIARGVVTDLGETSSAVRELVDRLEFQTKLRLEGTLLALNGSHLECAVLQARELLFEKGKEITARDVKHILRQAQSLTLSMNRRFLHLLLQGYVVDGQEGIRNPIGMYAHRLGVQLKGVTGVSSFVQNAVTSINRAGLEVEGIVLSGYATALAALGREERNLGTLFFEMGEEMSALLSFRGGGVTHLKLFPVGGRHITEKIAKAFGIPSQEAELLKKQYGSLFLPESAASHELLVSDGFRQKIILKKELCEVVHQATEELFGMFQKELKDLSSGRPSLTLAGGAALLEGIVETAGTFFQCSTRLGKIENVHFSKSLPLSSATAVGLLWYGHEKQKEERSLLPDHPAGRVFAKVKELFLNYF